MRAVAIQRAKVPCEVSDGGITSDWGYCRDAVVSSGVVNDRNRADTPSTLGPPHFQSRIACWDESRTKQTNNHRRLYRTINIS
jgi:hypothetical protein